MNRNLKIGFLTGAIALACVVLAAQGASLLVVNGKKSNEGVIREGDKVFVSLTALQEAGAEVSVTNDRVAIQFVPLKDKNQSEAAEGVAGEWIQNGGWRVRVQNVTSIKSPFGKGAGYGLTFEFRNLTNKTLNFGASGLKGMQLLDDNGIAMRYSVSSFKDLYKAAAPGNGFTNELKFGLDAGDMRKVGKPSKLLINFGQSGNNRFKNIRIDLS